MKRYKAVSAKDALGEVSRDVWEPETPSERAEALNRALSVGSHHPDRQIIEDVTEMRDLVDTGLIGMGWPPSGARVAVAEDGSWREISDHEELAESELPRWADMWIGKAAEPLSEAYFLGKMAFSLKVIEESLAANDMMTVFRHAMRLGMYQTEIDIRKIAGRYAEIGKKYLTSSEEGAAKRRGDFKAETQSILSEMADLVERGNSISNAARIVAKYGLGKSEGANRAIWYRHKKPVTRP
jgi:hypothetical protein